MANTTKVGRIHLVMGNATTEALNAGATVIVDADETRTITVIGGWARALGGAAATATVNVGDTADTSVVAIGFVYSALTQNTVARVGDANVTLTNVGTPLTAGKGLQIVSVGTLGTATSVDYCIEYIVT